MANQCIVCSRSVPGGHGSFCCPGCAAVYTIVEKMGLEGAARDERVVRLLEGVFPGGKEVEAKQNRINQGENICFLVDGMVCPACAWLVHHSLEKLEGVAHVALNFIAETCEVKFDPMKTGKDAIFDNIRKLGYRCQQGDAGEHGRYDYFRFGAGWFFALNNMMLSFVVYSAESWEVPLAMQWVCSLLLALFGTLVPLYAARPTMIAGFRQMRLFRFRMESLVALSTSAAWLFSVYAMLCGSFERLYFDVVTLLLMLIETGNLISSTFYHKLNRRVRSLAWQLPKKARVASDDFAAVETLEPGQEFLVHRSEVVPTDGVALEPAEFDFSLITGESREVRMEPGHFVGAGARLLSGQVRLVVPPGGRTNLIEKMVSSTIEAFSTRREQLPLGDRISQAFVPAVTVFGLLVLAFNAISGNASEGFVRLLGVLIVACPCSFGIAEPLVLAAAMEKVRGLGLQIFNGAVLALKPAKVVFDKTGTLTCGAPEVHAVEWLVEEDAKWLDILASLENGIEHPVACAVTQLGKPQPVAERLNRRREISAVLDGTLYRAGHAGIYPNVDIPAHMSDSTIILFGDDTACYLIVALKDRLRAESGAVVKGLKRRGLLPSIFSGDRTPVVAQVAEALAISDYHGEMSSTGKQQAVAKLQAAGETVMMVGDGINDAQALAAADIGLAVYSSQISAKMSADGVFMVPGIKHLEYFPQMQRKVRRKIRLNYSWAFLYNVIGMALAAAGWLSPKYCAVGMVFSNLVVIFHSATGMDLVNHQASLSSHET